jgi:hypothetical protein
METRSIEHLKARGQTKARPHRLLLVRDSEHLMRVTSSHLTLQARQPWWQIVRPSNPTFHQLYPQIQRKVHIGTVATSMASRQKAPRGIMVSAPTYGRRLTRQALELASSFLEKGWAMEVSAETTPDMTTAKTYRCAYLRTNTKRYTGGPPRRCTHHHRQVHYNKTDRGHAGTEASSWLTPYPNRGLL